MDPLTLTTSIITLLQATTTIITTCYDFRAALSNTPWSLTKIVEELRSLRGILEALDELALERNKSTELGMQPALDTYLNQDNGPLAICFREITSLAQKLKFSSCAGMTGRRRRAAIQALGWQLSEKDAKECLQRIDRCKNTLSLALTGNSVKLLVNLQELTSSVRATTLDTDSRLTVMADNIRNNRLDHEHETMMQWLSKADPYENHESANSIHLKGTNSWIFGCKDWEAWTQASSSFLWLSGFPGAGKTVLFSRIVSHLIDERRDNHNSIGVAYFYCDFRRKEFQCAKSVIGSIVAQLCSQFPCPDSLVVAHKNSKTPGQNRHPSWETLEQTLIRLSQDQKIFILVDAVDECEQGDELVAFFSKFRDYSTKLSVLFTSREEMEIELGCQSWPRIRMETRRVEVDVDIKLYITKRLEVDTSLSKLSPLVKAEIQNSLHQRCAGMFRWAQCQLDDLGRLRTVRSIRSSLMQLPNGLNETYERILKRTRKEDIGLLRKILLWASFAAVPLKLEELHDAIALDAGMDTLEDIEESRLNNPNDILSIAGSLIAVSDSGEIRLAHLSVKDYLLSTAIMDNIETSIFGMEPKQANEELVRCCLAYLSLDSLAEGPALTIEKWESRLARHPLLRHVAKAWPYYFRAANPSPGLNCLVFDFFRPESRDGFMSWVQVLNSNWIFKFDEYPKNATPLYYAASFGLESVVEDIIRSGADINAPGSRFGGTALHGATLREHTSIMEILLKAGGNPSQADNNSIAPLHTAARIGNLQVMKLLLDYGASKQMIDSLGETPYDWAVKAGQVGSQRLLKGEACELSYGARAVERLTVYKRPIASFPSHMISQGLSTPELMNSAICQPGC